MNFSEIAVKFDSVSFSYGDVQILESASFHIHHGEFAAMVGPNGSGKTTVLKLIFGLETPGKGTIELFGSSKPGERKRQMINLAYVPQHLPSDQMFPITASDVVRMGLLHPYNGYHNADEPVNEAMEQAGIADLAAKQYRSLSGGQKRRTLVARALAARPRLLVLDEPTANMDAESETRLYETLAFYKGKTTILIVTHDTEFVTALTDRVLCLGYDSKGDAGSRSIVQHNIEQISSGSHGGSSGAVRVLHNENIPADDCCRG